MKSDYSGTVVVSIDVVVDVDGDTGGDMSVLRSVVEDRALTYVNEALARRETAPNSHHVSSAITTVATARVLQMRWAPKVES